MLFEKIERIVVGVRDLEKAKSFFADILDIKFDETMADENLKIRAAYSVLGLELIESMTPESMIGKFIETRGEGVFGIVLKVTDMKAAVKKMEEKGMKRVGDMHLGGLTEIAFHPKGSHGLQIILAEYNAKHPATVAALGK
jgi:methylmalonyl-CoA/ethylmalonyl-CoA epimerase